MTENRRVALTMLVGFFVLILTGQLVSFAFAAWLLAALAGVITYLVIQPKASAPTSRMDDLDRR